MGGSEVERGVKRGVEVEWSAVEGGGVKRCAEAPVQRKGFGVRCGGSQ